MPALRAVLERKPVPWLVAWTLAVSACAWATMRMGRSGDTASYLGATHALRHLDFRHFDGLRTPGVPVLWVLGGSNPVAIALLQTTLVVASGMLLLWCLRTATGDTVSSWCAAAVYVAWPYVVDAERMLLSESLAGFLTLAVVALAQLLLGRLAHSRRAGWYLLLLGVALAWLALARPGDLSTVAAVLVVLGVRAGRVIGARRAAVMLTAALLPLLVAFGGWVAVMRHEVGVTQPSTLGGFALFDVTCRAIDHADPRDRDLQARLAPEVHRRLARRSALVKSCAGAFDPPNTFDGLDGVSHPSTAYVSRRLTDMSLRMARRDPLDVAQGVASQAVVQWLGLGYRTAGAMRPGWTWLRLPFSAAEVVLQVLLNAAFLGAAAWWLISWWGGRRHAEGPAYTLGDAGSLSIAIVFANAVSNPLLTAWLAGRFLVPTIGPELIVVVLAWRGFQRRRTRDAG